MSQYVNTAQLCEHFGISTTKLRSMLVDGAIPPDTYIQHGRTYRFNVDAVEKALLHQPKTEAAEEQLSFDFGEGETE